MSDGTASGNISYHPTAGLTYDPSDPLYWDEAALAGEVERVFEVCHGCRMCFKYCDSFPSLFSFVDAHEGDVRKVTVEQTEQVMDACFQCKLCEVQCPYTPRDDHDFQLDFPRLVHRYQAVRKRKTGFSLQDRVLGDPDGTSVIARASLGMANVMNRVSLHRWFLEKMLGIHRDKELPDFASTTFESWAKGQGRLLDAPPKALPAPEAEAAAPAVEAVLFQTCYVQNNEPEVGRDAIAVLDANQVGVQCVKGLDCCGMPRWERGDLENLRKQARNNLDKLMPFVDQGSKVLVINPTCSMMMRREYPELLEGEDRERATRLAEATMDVSEYVWSIRNEDRFNTDFKSSPGDAVSYHAPCHLRAQAVGFKGRDLLRKIPGVKPSTVMECCGHDGTYAMRVEGFEPSIRVGGKAFDGMKDNEASEVWATDCPLAAIQFKQHAGRKPMHPMSILARAYREDGFPKKLNDKEE
jgi:glycerol-3-phosphate dehydrogenase subunit C